MVRRGLVLALVLAVAGPADAIELARPMGMYPVRTGPALAMVDSRIEVTVRGPIVEAVVVQRFRNTGDRATEATYIFPLPPDAAVSAMAMRIGSRTIHAAIEPREAAQRRYEAAVSAGVAGALLEQERPDVFTQTVSAIPPGGIVEVTLRYDAVARYQGGRWELVLPMVVAPRHVPGTASGRATTGSGRAPDTDRAPDASRVTPAAAPG
jgi:Ca-activated chloride channel family protein